jgi:hypothetical protein
MRRFLASLLLALALLPGAAFAAPTFVTSATGDSVTSQSSISYAITVNSGEVLVATVSADSASSPTSVTYNGAAMTKLATSAGLDTTIWCLGSPATGSHNIAVTFSSNHFFVSTAMTFSGADTSCVADGTNSGTGSTNNAQVSVTTAAANTLIVAAGTHNRNSSVTAISGSTVRANVFTTTDNFRGLGITAPATTAGSYPIGWTMGTPSDGWWIAAFGLKAAATASGARSFGITNSYWW